MEEKSGSRPHSCLLRDRAGAALTGVREVVSFDESEVVVDTDQGLLTMKGKGLHVSRLTLEKGELDLDGRVDSLAYTSNEAHRKAGQPFFARIFG